jgi:biotin transport system substrate-specific component
MATRTAQTLDLVYIAIGAALITVCAWISIPLTVPFTLQTFAVFFILVLLGGRRGTLSVLVYILLGAVGIPVFAEFTGGLAILFGSTGGYILGFLLIGLIWCCFERLFPGVLRAQITALLLGLIACYAFGTVWFIVVFSRANGAVGLMTALSWCVLPFVLPDLVKLALAFVIARRVQPMLSRNYA